MKKLISVLFATVLMAAGLVVASGGTASAQCTPTQYGGCVDTTTKAKVPSIIGQNKRARVCGKVNAVGSNAEPTGRLVFKIKRKKGGYFEKQSVAYAGGKTCVITRVLEDRGLYNVQVVYKSPAGSVFRNSKGFNSFRVKG
jgi:hypothetical protein